MTPEADPFELPLAEIAFHASRGSGPGGQNVNKVNTRVTLRWNVRDTRSLPDAVHRRFLERFSTRIAESGELVFSSDQYRSQFRNKEDCLTRLREMIRSVWAAPRKRRKTKPSRAKKEARLTAKKNRGSLKSGRGKKNWD